MGGRRITVTVVAGLVLLGACSTTSETSVPVDAEPEASTAPDSSRPARTTTTELTTTTKQKPTTTTSRPARATTTTDASTTTSPPETTTTVASTSTTAAPASTTTTAPTETTATTVAPETTTATTVAPAAALNPDCVAEVRPGDSLTVLAARVGHESVSEGSLQIENGIGDPNALTAGQLLDICPGNLIDDVSGGPRGPFVPPPPPPPVDPVVAAVQAQQDKLNHLFYGLGMPPLTIDGVSGQFTKQQLCAARVALGLPASRADMVPGSPEEQALMAATSLPIPPSAPTLAPRWVLIDKTCQIMFVGEGGGRLVFVFQTSTGEAGYETRPQNASRVFRFNPARGNNGWHNSFDYPVPGDNPLNGNMYMPLYFDGGQAIHGANNVPTSPRSKGCARLRVENQDRLIDWLGIRVIEQPVWNAPDLLNLWVRVQGEYY